MPRVIDYDRGVVPAADPRPEAKRLGSYEILRKIARGGMAELFLARTHGPEGFEKLVVLKKILPAFAANPKFVRLFLDEARLAATLDHPHIAHVYDMGKVEHDYFFTMEYIHGQDVRATLRRTARMDRRFPIEFAIQITHAIAGALHYAHERRNPQGQLLDIVHRDVSPSNVLISYDGAIKLVDFGVAKAASSTTKTRTGTLKGKIAYMSPEQAKGGAIDRRSDVFSLGIVLWEMLATQRLFRGDNDLATIQLIINSTPPPVSEIRPEAPAELQRIVAKALANEPDQRYQTAEELQIDLEELAREQRMKQSPIALRGHMQDLFAAEIRAWQEAQESGLTLTDHVVSASVVEMTTPVSENEVSFIDDDEEDDPESVLQPTQGVITSTNPRPQAARPTAPPPVQPSIVIAPMTHSASGRVVMPRANTTPPPMPSSATSPTVQLQVSGPVSAPMQVSAPSPIASVTGALSGPNPTSSPSLPSADSIVMPSGSQPIPPIAAMPVRTPHHSESGPIVASFPREQTQFPIAPREWRGNAQDIGSNEPKRRKMIIAGLIGIAVLAVILLATGGRDATPASVAPVVVDDPQPQAVDMKVEPPHATEPAPVTTTPAPPPVIETPPPTTSAPTSHVPSHAPPPPSTSSHTTPPSTSHHSPPTTTPAKPPPATKTHKYDPNSALPPP